ncbi:geminin [Halyomorpha halys]|uniref:geminin n=1 Tax=Halyomorpha halys TaxID=286706 RepID=UPI0006D4DE8A|nr:geminin [Halyomorpha halys]
MKTDKAIKNLEAEKSNCNVLSEKKVVKGQRRTLRPLQKAAGDKENLVGAGLSTKQMPGKEVKEVTIVVSDSKVIRKIKTNKSNGKPVITEEDLTSEDGPSEGYWEILAERRRVALDAALKENEELHQRIALLEEENAQCKLLLDETRHLVETLTEVISEQPTATETEEGAEE